MQFKTQHNKRHYSYDCDRELRAQLLLRWPGCIAQFAFLCFRVWDTSL